MRLDRELKDLLVNKMNENLNKVKNPLDRESKAQAIVEALNHFDNNSDWVEKINRDEIISLITTSENQNTLCESIITKVNDTPTKEDNTLNESLQEKKVLQEGPGAGYSIKGSVSNLSDIKILDTKEEINKYNEKEVIVTATANCEISGVSASSYYYGREIAEGTHIPATIEINFTYWVNDFKNDNPEQVVKNYNDFEFDCGVGGGWSHVTFDGVIEGDYNDVEIDPYGCDTNTFKITITNENVIRDIDLAVTGEDWFDEYIVEFEDGTEEYFETEEEAIEYAKKNKGISVTHKQLQGALMNDLESEDIVDEYNDGVVWEREYTKSYKYDDEDQEVSERLFDEAFDKRDLYVNGDYVCSSINYKSNKDFLNKVLQDRKVKYAGRKALATAGVEQDELEIKPEDKVKVKKAKNENLQEDYSWYSIDLDKDKAEEVKQFLRDNKIYFEPSSNYDKVHFEIKVETDDIKDMINKYLGEDLKESLHEETKDDIQTKATKLFSVKKYYIDMAWKNGKTWKTEPMTLDEIAKSVDEDKIEEKQFVDMMAYNIKNRKDAKNLTKAEIVKVYDYMDGQWQGKDVLWSINGKTNESLNESEYVGNAKIITELPKINDQYGYKDHYVKEVTKLDTKDGYTTYEVVTQEKGSEDLGDTVDIAKWEVAIKESLNEDNDYFAYMDKDYANILDSNVDVYDIKQFVLDDTNGKYVPHMTDKYALIVAPNGKGCVVDYEAIGQKFDSVDSEIEFGINENKDNEYVDENGTKHKTINVFATHELTTTPKEVMEKAPKETMKYRDFFRKYKYNDRCASNFKELVSYIESNGGLQEGCHSKKKKTLKEGYIGQTLEDFFYDCVDPDLIETVSLWGEDDEIYNGGYAEAIDEYGDNEFIEFDCGMDKVVINVDTSEEYQVTTYFVDVADFIEFFNGDYIEVYDLNTGETLFDGDKYDLPDDVAEKIFVSFDAPNYISVNIEEYEDDDFDESLKEGKIREVTKAVDVDGNEYFVKPIWKTDRLATLVDKDGNQKKVDMGEWRQYYDLYDQDDEIISRFEDNVDESLKEDTVKQDGKWVNKGNKGETHGEFKTKKEADKQRAAMFSNKKPNAKWGK